MGMGCAGDSRKCTGLPAGDKEAAAAPGPAWQVPPIPEPLCATASPGHPCSGHGEGAIF